MKVLVTGWFSFEGMGATAGDLMTRDLACAWLRECRRDFDIAVAPPFSGGVNWQEVDPNQYSDVLFVCGPFGNGPPVRDFLARFVGRRLVGLNLTMLDPLEAWNPFALLIERDSSLTARPDLAFLAEQPRVPVVGVILIHPQPEYRERDLHRRANDAIRRFVATHDVAAVDIDTRLDLNNAGLRTAPAIESLIAKMDVVLTTRLHGLVLSLKNGVPVVAVDPVAGGAKITRQAQLLGWPLLLKADDAEGAALQAAFERARSPGAGEQAREAARRGLTSLADVRERFLQWYSQSE